VEAVRDLRAEDPVVLVLAWEAVEQLLADLPESRVKTVLRMVAGGLTPESLAHRLGVSVVEAEQLVDRGRVLVLSARSAVAAGALGR
jgi:DNA-directed RNA polymerase specialized sigma24 family protein